MKTKSKLSGHLSKMSENGFALSRLFHFLKAKFTSGLLPGILVGLAAAGSAQAQDLQIGPLGGCYSSYGGGASASGYSFFSLPATTGTGTLLCDYNDVNPSGGLSGYLYDYGYSLDLSGIQGTNHCVRLVIYFGTPASCSGNQLQVAPVTGGAPVLSATEAYSSITVQFGSSLSPCLSPGQTSDGFDMLSDQPPKYGYVTIIDDYVDAVSGLTNVVKIKVWALVPDIPPLGSSPLPPWFQGVLQRPYLGTNPVPAPDGIYDLGMQIYNAASNGLAIGPMMTQSVAISNGLVNAPMNFDPSVFFSAHRWLSLSVRPTGGTGNFTMLNPLLPISPTPQAIYAYTAGSVADLAPGQAVTSLNGLTDAVNLQAGSAIVLGTNGNTLIVSAIPGAVSDRSLKTDFAAINPAEVLARLAALPVQSWRYTNELAQVRHIGPMAQDFMQTFKLGSDNKIIGYVDENGVALAAIQGLNQKVEEQKVQKAELKARLEKLEKIFLIQKQP